VGLGAILFCIGRLRFFFLALKMLLSSSLFEFMLALKFIIFFERVLSESRSGKPYAKC